METTRHPSSLALLLASGLLVGCATLFDGEDGAGASAGEADTIEYTVQRGDQLGDIAREYTGDVGQWRRIAEHNGIEDPRTLREGTVLEIPAALIRRGRAEDAAGEERAVPPPPATGRDVAPPSRNAGGVERTAVRAVTITPVAAPEPRRVQVVGSYFPKGVYAQPANYSKLIMRVAPGTLFELDRQVRGWYGVRIEEGIGYLREGDARLLEEADRG